MKKRKMTKKKNRKTFEWKEIKKLEEKKRKEEE